MLRLGRSGRSGLESQLTVGQLAVRSGVTVSALHFYETEGLIHSTRTAGNQRRYPREVLRRVAFVRASQQVGIPLRRIRQALDALPRGAPRPVAIGRSSRPRGKKTSTSGSFACNTFATDSADASVADASPSASANS